jgi:hypothetical protein
MLMSRELVQRRCFEGLIGWLIGLVLPMDRQRASKLKTHQGQHADEPRASTEAVF